MTAEQSEPFRSVKGGDESSVPKIDDASVDQELEMPASRWSDDENVVALIGSMLWHTIVILGIAMVPTTIYEDPNQVVIESNPTSPPEEIEVLTEVSYSEEPQTEIGAESLTDSAMAEASAAEMLEIAEIPTPLEMEPIDRGEFLSNPVTMVATAPMDRLDLRMGSVGSGASGASGAVDQLTFEVLRLLEERPTTVIWLFDQSRSLQAQRATIRERFDRMYLELGMAEDKNLTSIKSERDAGNIPLLTSIYAFGEKVQQVTPEPLESLAEIQQAMESIKDDDSGVERIFEAVTTAAREAKSFTRMVSVQTPDGRIRREPRRNVMLIVVTDERGDDISQLDSAIAECKKFGIPVSIIGVPAPFGKAVSEIKYVDPDPQFDQTPQVGLVNQGPESYLPEVVDIGFISRDKDLTLDSGFGPYGLTRLCYETGGIYLSVHPNRKIGRRVRFGEIDPFAAHFDYFFDPVVMRRYRPDYLPPRDYLLAVKQSPLRDSLVRAASMKGASGLDRPRLRFVVTEAAQLKREIDQAQTTAATLMPALDAMARMLEPGMSARDKEGSPRWRAGYDLAAGRVLAQLVRTDAYNYILADLESGRKRFEKEKNNTWILEPSDDLSFSSKLNNRAKAARELLEDVVNDHPDTPWALLAKTELDVPMGWQWKEDFTDLSPPQRTRPGNNNNNPNRMPRDDQKRMIDRKEKRPLPKL